MADDYMEDDATPSQAALDSQLQGQAALAQAHAKGGLSLARSQIMDAINDGANAAAGRELLGTIDQMEEFPESGDPKQLYSDFRKFVGGQPAAAAPAGQAPAPSPAKKAVNLNKKRAAYARGETNEYPG